MRRGFVAATWLLCSGLLLLLAVAPGHALTISSANLGAGRGCVDAACADPRLTVDSSASGSGTITVGVGVMTFSVLLPSSIFVPLSGPDDNGVTSLEFDTVTYSGAATIFQAGPVISITGGSASVSGTQTPSGAGAAGAFSALDSLLGGSCTDLGTSLVCGIVFSAFNDFDFDVNGQTRYFTHTLNLTAVPEPGTAILLAGGIIAMSLAARRRI